MTRPKFLDPGFKMTDVQYWPIYHRRHVIDDDKSTDVVRVLSFFDESLQDKGPSVTNMPRPGFFPAGMAYMLHSLEITTIDDCEAIDNVAAMRKESYAEARVAEEQIKSRDDKASVSLTVLNCLYLQDADLSKFRVRSGSSFHVGRLLDPPLQIGPQMNFLLRVDWSPGCLVPRWRTGQTVTARMHGYLTRAR